MFGYYRHIDNTYIINVDVQSIYKRLVTAKQKNQNNIVIETDSQVAKMLIEKDVKKNHLKGHVIEECQASWKERLTDPLTQQRYCYRLKHLWPISVEF